MTGHYEGAIPVIIGGSERIAPLKCNIENIFFQLAAADFSGFFNLFLIKVNAKQEITVIGITVNV